MTRLNPREPLEVDLEIEKTDRSMCRETIRRGKWPIGFEVSDNEIEGGSSAVTKIVDELPCDTRVDKDPPHEPEVMAKNRTIRQLAEAIDEQQSLCVAYLTNRRCVIWIEVKFDTLIATFHGLQNKNLHKHLNKFHTICLNFVLSFFLNPTSK